MDTFFVFGRLSIHLSTAPVATVFVQYEIRTALCFDADVNCGWRGSTVKEMEKIEGAAPALSFVFMIGEGKVRLMIEVEHKTHRHQ